MQEERERANPDAVVLAGLDLLVHEHVLGREAAELLAVLALHGAEEDLGRAVGLLALQDPEVAAVDERVQRERDLLAVDAVPRELAPDARLRQALRVLVAQPIQQVAQVCHPPSVLSVCLFVSLFVLFTNTPLHSFRKKKTRNERKIFLKEKNMKNRKGKKI